MGWALWQCVLNCPSVINDDAINLPPQTPINEALDIMSTREELLKAISQLSSGKASGSDSILAEMYKNGGPALVLRILQLFLLVGWQQETVPQDLKDASIIHLYKRKGNCLDCNNHHGISLLSIAGKILARIILNRLTKHLEQGLPESQCGFQKERGTVV